MSQKNNEVPGIISPKDLKAPGSKLTSPPQSLPHSTAESHKNAVGLPEIKPSTLTNKFVPALTSNIITVVRDPNHMLGKRITRQADGTISKQSSVSVSFGIAIMHQVDTHDEMAALLVKVGNDPNAAIINAGFNGINIGEEFIILSEREIEHRLGIPCANRDKQKGVHQIQHDGKPYKAVGRFKENVRPSTWQYLDRDIDQHTPAIYAALTFED
jgi:hypothetical protein